MSQERLERLEEMLAARTDKRGRPAPGYVVNVAMIKDEMRRIQSELEQNNGE